MKTVYERVVVEKALEVEWPSTKTKRQRMENKCHLCESTKQVLSAALSERDQSRARKHTLEQEVANYRTQVNNYESMVAVQNEKIKVLEGQIVGLRETLKEGGAHERIKKGQTNQQKNKSNIKVLLQTDNLRRVGKTILATTRKQKVT